MAAKGMAPTVADWCARQPARGDARRADAEKKRHGGSLWYSRRPWQDTSASAEGELGRTPLAHQLVYAMDHRLSGRVLFLTPPDGPTHVVRLVRGAPVKVRPGDRHALLGEMLVEAGAIDQATLDGALATKGLLGDV